MQVGAKRHFFPQKMVTMDTAYCIADCTTAGLPENGGTVIGNFMHAHTAGTAMALRHIRNGVELEPIDVNEHYDFNFQQITFVFYFLLIG